MRTAPVKVACQDSSAPPPGAPCLACRLWAPDLRRGRLGVFWIEEGLPKWSLCLGFTSKPVRCDESCRITDRFGWLKLQNGKSGDVTFHTPDVECDKSETGTKGITDGKRKCEGLEGSRCLCRGGELGAAFSLGFVQTIPGSCDGCAIMKWMDQTWLAIAAVCRINLQQMDLLSKYFLNRMHEASSCW